MKKTNLLLSIGLALLATSCSTIKIKYDYYTKADFSKYHTFDFMSVPEKAGQNELFVGRIQEAATRQLEAKGFKRTSENPDLLIAVHTRHREKLDIQSYGYAYFPFPYYWRPFGYWGRPWGLEITPYDEGKIILDFVDAASNNMVWRGVAVENLPDNENPTTIHDYIEKAITKMLRHFPPNA